MQFTPASEAVFQPARWLEPIRGLWWRTGRRSCWVLLPLIGNRHRSGSPGGGPLDWGLIQMGKCDRSPSKLHARARPAGPMAATLSAVGSRESVRCSPKAPAAAALAAGWPQPRKPTAAAKPSQAIASLACVRMREATSGSSALDPTLVSWCRESLATETAAHGKGLWLQKHTPSSVEHAGGKMASGGR